MNVLFISSVEYDSLNERNIYTDLLREFQKKDWHVYALSPRSNISQDEVDFKDNATVFRPFIPKMQKTGYAKKMISLLILKHRYIKAIKKHVGGNEVDLILYTTPPVNIVGVIDYCKTRYKAKTYLMLKDIWPDGIADLGVIKKNGLIYGYFRSLEKRLYSVSDRIGCMSQANIDYVITHNPGIAKDKVEYCPNSIEPLDIMVSSEERNVIRNKYGLPLDKTVLVYGGNLGKPQGIPFILECLSALKDNDRCYFLIVGSGTEYKTVESFIATSQMRNVKVLPALRKTEYYSTVAACDIGLIFLDNRFTIPNFPSRLLSYMEARIPVLAATDPNTDVGKVILEGGFGYWCESNNPERFKRLLINMCDKQVRTKMGENAHNYLMSHYTVQSAYETIIKHMN